MDRALRLIAPDPLDELARTLEALLVVASQPLTEDELAAATVDDPARVDDGLALLGERYREGRSGIVLEHVAGGWAFRASREAAEACARLYERPVERGLSQAALETLAIVAYLGPCSRPEIARIRGVNVDGVVAGLVERGLLAEAGRDGEFGAVRYRTTPLFERVFGLESLAALPRLDDLGDDVGEIRVAPRSGRREAPGLSARSAGRALWTNRHGDGTPRRQRSTGRRSPPARRTDDRPGAGAREASATGGRSSGRWM